MKKIILHLCADTGSDTQPYRRNGYEVVCIGKDIGVENIKGSDKVYGIIANPPCTNFSSVRTSAKIPRNEEEGMRLVKECQRIISECPNLKFWVIENPATGLLKKYLGKPQFTYQPWEFGSPWSKKTALWGKFNCPEKKYKRWEDVPNKIPELYIRPGRNKPNMVYLHKSAIKYIPEFNCFKVDSDMELRSLCSQKLAQEFYNINN
jgi:site-specific DNA-cytosine methylase